MRTVFEIKTCPHCGKPLPEEKFEPMPWWGIPVIIIVIILAVTTLLSILEWLTGEETLLKILIAKARFFSELARRIW